MGDTHEIVEATLSDSQNVKGRQIQVNFNEGEITFTIKSFDKDLFPPVSLPDLLLFSFGMFIFHILIF